MLATLFTKLFWSYTWWFSAKKECSNFYYPFCKRKINILKLKYEFKSTRFLSEDLVFKFWEFQVSSKARSKFKKKWLRKLKQMHILLLKKTIIFQYFFTDYVNSEYSHDDKLVSALDVWFWHSWSFCWITRSVISKLLCFSSVYPIS